MVDRQATGRYGERFGVSKRLGMVSNAPEARAKVRALGPSLIREVANAAMHREGVLRFWFGESDQPTPRFIREAAAASLRDGETFYTENLGRRYLREGIAEYVTGLHGRRFGVERIAVTSSGDSALMLASQMVLDPGDRAVLVTPMWPNLVEIPRILGAEPVCVPLEVSGGRWVLPMEKVIEALTPETRMLYVNSPNNPTGWTFTVEEQRMLLEHCRERGIWILADDVYERLYFGEGEGGRVAPSFLSIAEEGDRVISINSFSKAWRMTGWRVGWMVVPPALLPALASLIEYNTSCVPEFVQRAAAVALREGEGEIDCLRGELVRARERLLRGLHGIAGVDVPAADGAMYAFFRIAGERDSVGLAKRLVEDAGLGLAPGRAFGPEGEGWLRWCYATELGKIDEGVERLRRFLRGR